MNVWKGKFVQIFIFTSVLPIWAHTLSQRKSIFRDISWKGTWGFEILCGIFHVVFHFLLHFMVIRGNSDYFSNSVVLYCITVFLKYSQSDLPPLRTPCGEAPAPGRDSNPARDHHNSQKTTTPQIT